jgi:hypothetical protein
VVCTCAALSLVCCGIEIPDADDTGSYHSSDHVIDILMIPCQRKINSNKKLLPLFLTVAVVHIKSSDKLVHKLCQIPIWHVFPNYQAITAQYPRHT